MKKKFISLVLATAMVFSLLAFGAPSAGAYDYAPELTVAQGYLNSLFSFLSASYSAANGRQITAEDVNAIGSKLKFPSVGKVSYSALEECAAYYNASLYGHVNALIGNGNFQSRGAVRYQAENDIYRIYDHALGKWVVDGNGDFPYADGNTLSGDVPAGEGSGSAGTCRWLSASGTEITNNFRVYSKEVIDAKALELTNWGHPCQAQKVKIGPKGKEVECWAIRDDYWYYYCDEDGNRLVALVEPSVTETPRPTVDNSGNLIEGDNGFIMDNDNGIFAVVDQIGNRYELNFDGSVWDFSSDSYTLNAYTTVNEGDNYYYTYYTYNIQYNITNTYITYIGSNDAYEREEYELYYQLPDGRSSADLTADEIAGMSFEFYDVVNYQRSTDNVHVRGLYHFDGNLDDSSYFYEADRFSWIDGASITYMDAGESFGGALYLDNTHHEFEIRTPSRMGKGSWSLQFRYYQASEPDTLSNVENFVYIYETLTTRDYILRWDESTLYNMYGTALAALPVGTWNEIAIVQDGGYLSYYLNGCFIGKCSMIDGITPNSVRDYFAFEFGSTSRAYSMIDELRIVDFPITDPGSNYLPTSVPHDSNLTLVLPGTARPIADEYWLVKPGNTNLLGFTPTTFTSGTAPSLGKVKYNSTMSDFVAHVDGYTELTRKYLGIYDNTSIMNTTQYNTESSNVHSRYHDYGNGLFVLVRDLCTTNTSYTLSVVLEDGSIHSFTFTTPSSISRTSKSDKYTHNLILHKEFDGIVFQFGQFGYGKSGSTCYSEYIVSVAPAFTDKASLGIIYMELVQGKETNLSVEKVTSIYDADEISGKNIAAIQSSIPVNGYQVGGVRPSLPSRGDCWFPVMDNRITSVQIYTGTHWEEVNARWWTGSRWIPIYAFDITTLEDLFDIADGDSTVPLLPEGTDSFLRWWQIQWLDFRSWLEDALSNIGSGGGGTSLPDEEELPGEDAGEGDDHGWSFVDLIYQTKDGIWAVTKGIVQTAAGGITGLVLLIGDAGSFFEPFQSDHPEGIFGALNYGGDDIWD